MPADQAKLSATRPRPSGNFTPSPAPVAQNKTTSPWIPFSVSVVLLAATAGGLFYYMDQQIKSLQGIETKLLKTNEFVLAMDKRLKKIEDSIASSDAEAEAAGSSLTSKMLNLESRMSEAEKGIGWNSSRINKQTTSVETIETRLSELSSSVNSQSSKITENSNKIAQLSNQENPAEALTAQLSEQVESNRQAIETMDAHRSRMSSAIQKVQADVARLIRLYEKDNPSAKRVQ